MNANPADMWTCSGCGDPITDLSEPRKPCENCGSTLRTAHETVTISATTTIYIRTHSKHRDGGRKAVREVIEGDDYHRKSGKWSVMRRLIDRANNWYEEIFRDRETNQIVHHSAEPLTEHRQRQPCS
jgi:hypothetical protein